MQHRFSADGGSALDAEGIRREVDTLLAWSRGLRAWTLEVCTASMEARAHSNDLRLRSATVRRSVST